MEEIELTAHEDVTEFTDDEQVSVEQVNLEFSQQSKLKGIRRELTIFNDIQCHLRVVRKHRGKVKYRANLTYLDASPKRKFKLASNWIVTTVIGAILSFMLIYLAGFSQLQIEPLYASAAAIATVAFTLIALMMSLLRTSDRVLFYSRCGRVPILEFLNKNPDKETFSQFIKTLRRHILLAQQQAQSDTTHLLKLELQELRRLRDEGVIQEDQYESAKKKILSNPAFSASSQ